MAIEVKSTRLRRISVPDLDMLEAAVEGLGFKVEIKGGPVWDGTAWYLFFVIPDTVQDFQSITLEDVP